MVKRLLTSATDTIYALPVVVLMPHSRCNCRCVMCDIWKANDKKIEITTEELSSHIDSFRKLGVKHVAFSGGEALMHSNLWKFCELLKSIDVKISLLSSGVTLKAHADNVVKYMNDVVVSLDGPHEIHNQIRNLPSAFEKLEAGVRALKRVDSSFRVTGRCVLQKLNFRHLPNIILASKSIGLDQISFLAADVSSSAFNREQPWADEKTIEIALTSKEVGEFEKIVTDTVSSFAEFYTSKFIAESPAKMLRLVQYYKAVLGETSFPAKKCNAPWASAVIQSDGEVRPCFFHKSYGNLHGKSLTDVLNSRTAISFRKNLDMKQDPICNRCVCSLHVSMAQ
jgi:MoaA/NifB/PqqE/SkfB family radical SAM enzyme